MLFMMMMSCAPILVRSNVDYSYECCSTIFTTTRTYGNSKVYLLLYSISVPARPNPGAPGVESSTRYLAQKSERLNNIIQAEPNQANSYFVQLY